jgi:hypothetical protein
MTRKMRLGLLALLLLVLTIAGAPKASAWDPCDICVWRCDNAYVGCLQFSNPNCDASYSACIDDCYFTVCS